MAMLRHKPLVAMATVTQEEHHRNGQSPNMSGPRINEEHITQIFTEMEDRVPKKLSHELSWPESCILGALSELDDLLLNPLVRTQSGTFPGTTQNLDV